MMDSVEGAEDDQGSGWFEVRKKHRFSSKASIQKVSGGPSNKSYSQPWHYQASSNDKVRRLPSEQQAGSFKKKSGFSSDSNISVNASGKSSEEAEQSLSRLDKLVTGIVSDHSLKASNAESKAAKEFNVQGKSDDLPKIRWGNIEDVSLTVSVSGASSKTMKIERAHFANCNPQKEQNLVAATKSEVFNSSSTHFMEERVASENVERSTDGVLSSDTPEVGTWMEVTGVSSACKDIKDIDPKDAFKNIKESRGFAGVTQNKAMDGFIADGIAVEGCPTLGSPVAAVEVTTEKAPNEFVDRTVSISEESFINDVAAGKTGSPHNFFEGSPLHNLPKEKDNGVENSAEAAFTITVGDVLTDGPDLGDGEQGESKERFRERLWCFLFENLNRAVDELYLLCELECDTEQMNEAILVLEEAISDFGELNCRVQHFENTKKTAGQSSNDLAMTNLKTEHRRPHSLSWEVRRMTTSPHRAEILSSSLEAFRKIQMARSSKHVAHDGKDLSIPGSTVQHYSGKLPRANDKYLEGPRISSRSENHRRMSAILGNTTKDKLNSGISMQSRSCLAQAGHITPEKPLASAPGKCKREALETISEVENQASTKDKMLADNRIEKQSTVSDIIKRNNSLSDKEKEKDKRTAAQWKSMHAWKEKRNWEDILKSPFRSSCRLSCSPGVGRKGVERARVLHDKLMSPEKKKKCSLDMRREAEERHARAMRIRGQLENERLQRIQRTSEKLNRVNEWQAVRSLKLREGLSARHQRSESRHEAYLAQVVKRAGDESSKVNEVRFITSLNEENKKLILRQKLHDSELRRAEKIQIIRVKQKEDTAREEAVMERRKLIEAEKLQRLAETQKKKEEAQIRREEERKASSAAREAKAVEQRLRKEIRARVQQEEAELLAQKLAEKLSESEQRRKFYLEQIREKASTDFRDQSSPLLRRSLNREGLSRHISTACAEDNQTSCLSVVGDSASEFPYPAQMQSLKRRIKRIRQRLMALKHEFIEPPFVTENSVVGYRVTVGTARVKIGKWLQELQRLRQARKEGAASIGLIVGDMIKFLEGKDLELHVSRQAGLLDFISSALPASHTSKPEACQVTVYLLRLLRVVLSIPANRGYFLAQNHLPPIIPMLSASLDNYIKVAASSNSGNNNLLSNRTADNMDIITEVLDGFLLTVTVIMGCRTNDERQLQMQDGLLELIVSYQAVHRLRDLFALYDRPQVEGSPFPSSIMLSLNLLSVLTSRPGSFSSIDWLACMSKLTSENNSENSQVLEYHDVQYKIVMNDPSEDSRSQLLQMVTVPSTGEYMPADGSAQMLGKRLQPGGAFPSDTSDCNRMDFSRTEAASVADAFSSRSQNFKLVVQAKSSLDQEHHNITMDRERNDEHTVPDNPGSKKEIGSKQPVPFLLSAVAETGLVSLTSLLTAVLLQANNRLSSGQASYVLPSNFEEVATGVLKVLNNLALLDISLLQKMLARSDLKMEFFHLMSFLLSHCTSRWKSSNDQVGLLLLESLLLLGYFALFHSGNQAVLRWGKSPTILHKVCDLPFVFFSDPELTPILAGTFVAICYGCERNRDVVQQELSMDMLLTLLRSCKPGLLTSKTDPSRPDSNTATISFDSVSSASAAKKSHGDTSSRSNRKGLRNVLGRVVGSGNRVTKSRVQRDNRGTKTCDDWAFKHNLPASESSSTFMLHRRFPACFLDKAEEFFADGNTDLPA